MKKILLLSALLFGMGISNASIAQQKAPLPKKGSDQVVPDYKKPTQVSAPKSIKPTNAPKGEVKSTGSAAATPNTIKPGKGSAQMVPGYKKPTQVSDPKSIKPTNAPKGGVKSTSSAAATPNTIKPGKGSAQMVPDYKKPTQVSAPKSGKPTNAPKTAEGVKPAPTVINPTKGKPALPKNAMPIKTIEQKPKGEAITNTKGQQGPKPGKGSAQMVPDYKKPTHLPATKGGKPTNAPKAGKDVKPVAGTTKPTGGIKPAPTTTKPTGGIKPAPTTTKPTGGIKPAPTTTKPTGGIKPAPTTTKPTGGIKPAPTTTKPVVLKPKNNKTPEATVEIKSKSKGSDQVVPDYKSSAKKPK